MVILAIHIVHLLHLIVIHLVAVHIDALAIHVVLEGSQMSWGSPALQLLVLILESLDLLLLLLDHDIDHLQVFHLLSLVLVGVHGVVEELARLVLDAELDLLLQLVLLLLELIDALQELHIVVHQSCVRLTVLLQGAGKLHAIVQNVNLMSTALSVICIVCINVGFLAICLLLDPGLIKTNHTFLELFVVLNVLHHLEDVILESLLLKLLHV